MKNIKKQQQVAAKILSTLQSVVDPEAILAGGAPRDWWHERPANDLDIYLRSAFGSRLKYSTDLITRLFEGATEVAVCKTYGGISSLNLQLILNFKYLGESVQLMFVDGNCEGSFLTHIVRSFDTGICKIAWDGESYRRDSRYAKDIRDKTLTFYPDSMSDQTIAFSMVRHIPKLLEYFPDHKFRVSTKGERPK